MPVILHRVDGMACHEESEVLEQSRLAFAAVAASGLLASGCTGCEPHTAVLLLSNPTVRTLIKETATAVSVAVLSQIVLPAVVEAAARPAMVTSGASPGQHAPPADRLACAAQPTEKTCTTAAEAAAATATERALREVTRTPPGQSVRGFECRDNERTTACEARFRQELEARTRSHVEPERAQRFADAWPACRDQVHNDASADTVSRVVERVNACMEARGFATEIAAIKLVYGRDG